MMPVIDGANLVENSVTASKDVAIALKQVEQYATQIDQYNKQLDQYANMLQNTAAPGAYVWDKINDTINQLHQVEDQFNKYVNTSGISNYLSQFKNVSNYEGAACFKDGSCTDADRQALIQQQENGSQSEKLANDALMQELQQQQQNLGTDSANLQTLQAQAGNADGQMKALQAANQLSSATSNQLIQIRSLLIAQQTAEAARAEVAADKKAQQAAGDEQFRSGTYTKSPPQSW